MGGKRNGPTSSSNAVSEVSDLTSTTGRVSGAPKRLKRVKLTNRSDHLEYLALPNIHVVTGVLKEHFKTLDCHHVKRLEHLIDQIKTKRDENTPKCEALPKKIREKYDKREKRKKPNSGKKISSVSVNKSDESWATFLPVEIDNQKDLSTKCNECQTDITSIYESSHRTSFKSVNTSSINLVDAGTCIPELKSSSGGGSSVSNADSQLKKVVKNQQPIVIPNVRFIESADTFYTCSTELSNFSNKLIVIKICLSEASNDISVDCKLTNRKSERSLPLKLSKRLDGAYRLFESYKQSFVELLEITDFNEIFKHAYICIWSIVEVLWSLYISKLPYFLGLKDSDDVLVTKTDNTSAPKLKKYAVKRNYGRKKQEILEIFRVSNVCSILG